MPIDGISEIGTAWRLNMEKDSIPEVLAVSPISLTCPLCGAKPHHDCVPGHEFGFVHVARIRAAAAKDMTKRESRDKGRE